MVQDLKLFFTDYPRQILEMQGVRPAELPAGLMDELLDYRERSLANLENAQVFRIDIDAYWMMSELVNEMKRDGLNELFSKVQLPFPTMIIMLPLVGADGIMRQNDGSVLGLVTQDEEDIYTQRFAIRQNTVGPSVCCMLTKGMAAAGIPTPTQKLFQAIGMSVPDGMIDEEQSDLNRLEAEQADLRKQIPRFRDVEEDRKRLGREITDLVDLIGQDVIEREAARKFAVQAFGETSKFLYDEPGQLILGKSRGVSGLSIETDIVGKKSGGKNHMQVFCFDWLLVETAKKNDRFPGFLIHDSHIFDGVDGRQIGLALKLAQWKSEQLGVQYIVAMNSDDLQKIKHEEDISGEEIFDPTDFIMPTRLSDDAGGGLFGIRF
jgi:hypothetical protein